MVQYRSALFFEMTFLEGSGPYQQGFGRAPDPHAKGYASD
jgi:hypothetical protein